MTKELKTRKCTSDLLLAITNSCKYSFNAKNNIFIHYTLVDKPCKCTDYIKKFVTQNAVPISSIEPDFNDYSDLNIIGKAIGNSKIVMLGEQDHGDAPTFLAKTRLIKYLHEKLGFNVLAFESDYFGLNFGFDRLDKNKPNIDSFLKKNIFPIWTYCNTCQNLFYDYIPATYQTKNPLTITGFDNQLVLNFSSGHLVFI